MTAGKHERPRAVHRADLCLEAWAPTREACIAEAVSALVGSFLGRTLPSPSSTRALDVTGSTDADLLRTVLHKVIVRLRTRNELPAATEVVATPAGLRLRCEMIDAGAVVPVGAIPKAVSGRRVRCERTPGGWWCSARIDV